MEQNIHTLAAKFNFFSKENIPAEFREYWNLSPRIRGEHIIIPEGLKNLKNIEVDLFFKCVKEEEYNTIQGNYILVKLKSSDLLCVLNSYKEKYRLHPYWEYIREAGLGLDSYKISKITNEQISPNKIGVFTEKKISDWVTYCENYINALKTAAQTVESTNNKHKKEIEDFINSLDKVKEVRVERYENRTTVYTPLFTVDFKLFSGSGYLEKKIVFSGNINDVSKILNKLV